MPRIRATPEDFEVEEIPLFPLSGAGSHGYLFIEKREQNTDDVIRALARALGLPEREVGYAGRKDRHAVTRQWFSVPVTDPARLAALALPGARVLAVERHSERLRVGQLAGNRFRLVVREVDEAAGQAAVERLDDMAVRGVPNRYGRQRFGRDGRNVERGLEVLRGDRVRGDRRRAWLMVSALQSLVFNRVLERRLPHLDRLLAGDLAIVHATGELFLVADPAADAGRVAAFAVSATGPIFGTKMRTPRGEAAALEDAVMAELGLPAGNRLAVPRGLKLFGERRPLRIAPRHVRAEWRQGALHLEVELPAGSYVTVLLEELFPEGLVEGGDGDEDGGGGGWGGEAWGGEDAGASDR